MSQVEWTRKLHLTPLYSALLIETQFSQPIPLLQIPQVLSNTRFAFTQQFLLLLKCLLLIYFSFQMLFQSPSFFCIESACPGDIAKPAFDQCLTLLDAQGCVF